MSGSDGKLDTRYVVSKIEIYVTKEILGKDVTDRMIPVDFNGVPYYFRSIIYEFNHPTDSSKSGAAGSIEFLAAELTAPQGPGVTKLSDINAAFRPLEISDGEGSISRYAPLTTYELIALEEEIKSQREALAAKKQKRNKDIPLSLKEAMQS